ncbi:MAG TPA: hypothetical protein VHR97_13725 [Candidatus Baltobacteraceae bacterium]|nr:hypothetical protein [Candidatus Baltobacteraceae bacterium]
MPHLDVTPLHSGAVLSRWGVKPADLLNLLVAATALVFSLYNYNQANAAQHKKMLFGGYMLGQDYERLQLCEQKSPYAHCPETLANSDFKLLNPMLDTLLEMQIDWPLDPNKAKRSDDWSDPMASRTIILNALNMHYGSRAVGSAFVVGSSLIMLFSMVDDPAVATDKSKRDAYNNLVGGVNSVLARDLQGICSNKLGTSAPNRTDLLNLNDCLNSEWLPL